MTGRLAATTSSTWFGGGPDSYLSEFAANYRPPPLSPASNRRQLLDPRPQPCNFSLGSHFGITQSTAAADYTRKPIPVETDKIERPVGQRSEGSHWGIGGCLASDAHWNTTTSLDFQGRQLPRESGGRADPSVIGGMQHFQLGHDPPSWPSGVDQARVALEGNANFAESMKGARETAGNLRKSSISLGTDGNHYGTTYQIASQQETPVDAHAPCVPFKDSARETHINFGHEPADFTTSAQHFAVKGDAREACRGRQQPAPKGSASGHHFSFGFEQPKYHTESRDAQSLVPLEGPLPGVRKTTRMAAIGSIFLDSHTDAIPQSTMKSSFVSHPQAPPPKPAHRALVSNVLVENCDEPEARQQSMQQSSFAKAAAANDWSGRCGAEFAETVKDLRAHHFSLGSDDTVKTSVAQEDYKPVKGVNPARLLSTTKAELRKSHFAVGVGEGRDFITETAAAMRPFASRDTCTKVEQQPPAVKFGFLDDEARHTSTYTRDFASSPRREG